jgi:transposase
MNEGNITQQEASRRLGITPRQVRRLSKRFKEAGLSGLMSRKRGKPSNRKLPEGIRNQIIGLIGTHYSDFGPTLVCEKLNERHDLHLSIEGTRQLMMSAGYWKPKRGGVICAHPMRERRSRFGEMIQIDGSPHDWFEGRSESCTLLVFIDDATGLVTQIRFVPNETTHGYMRVLHNHILAYGVPVSLYSDKHSIFRINAKGADPEAETQFSRAARELGIECIHAHSPQAKGRVERANQTLQDRLVKEMRLEGIDTMEQANEWLPDYLAKYNQRFAVKPKEADNAHVAYLNSPDELFRTLSIQSTRILSKNLTCQYKNQFMQIETTGAGLSLRGAKVNVLERFDGQIDLVWMNRKLTYSTIERPIRQSLVVDGKGVNDLVNKAVIRRKTGHKPSANHPWKKMSVSLFTPDRMELKRPR